MLSAPADYLHSGGFTIPNAGSRGLTGSTPETDRILAFQSVGARIVHDSGTGSIDLPDLTLAQGDNGLAAVAVTDGTLNDSVPLTGTAYAGVGDFVAYLLRTNNNASEPFYIIHGTGTDIATLDSLNQADQIREYSLTADPLRPNNVGAPFSQMSSMAS